MRRLLHAARIKWWRFIVERQRKREDYAGCLETLEKILKMGPRDAGALVRAGYCLRKLNRTEEALALFHRALEISPNYGDAHANLSLAYRDLGRNQEAIDSLNRAVRIK